MHLDDLRRAHASAVERLLAERTGSHWTGRLSSSALSTATAATALALVSRDTHRPLVELAMRWLAAHQNSDGGWGDTPDSPSNLATTMLVRAVFAVAATPNITRDPERRAEEYLTRVAGPATPDRVRAVRACYGSDRTFSTPILAMCAAAGLVDWADVPPLPFELARLPQSSFRLLRLHVVSYALPALIAIGQAIHKNRPTGNPLKRFIRNRAIAPTLRRLERIQPASGGFLEATPLTSFVVLSLAAAGRADHPVARKGVEFLLRVVRDDGSWPIDTNLATWVTTQAVDALSLSRAMQHDDALTQWLINQQHTTRHPYTGSAPGGWAWTDLSGGVPDADDTPGALIALILLGASPKSPELAIGRKWLLDLQNSDGGWPSFCRGWGKLPFDRSSPDLTAHAIRAIMIVSGGAPLGRSARAVARGFDFLRRTQLADGSWRPLWFGNQSAPDHANPVYGTARVLGAYAEAGRPDCTEARRAAEFLRSAQNADGGWGGAPGVASTVEETALAVRALAELAPEQEWSAVFSKGSAWLTQRMRENGLAQPAPIGLYFASLWYSESLYPVIWTVGALGAAIRALDARGPEETT